MKKSAEQKPAGTKTIENIQKTGGIKMENAIVEVYNRMKSFKNIDIDALNTAVEKFINDFQDTEITDKTAIYYGIRSKYKSLTGNKSKRQTLENSLFSELSEEIKSTVPSKTEQKRLDTIWGLIDNSIRSEKVKEIIYLRFFDGQTFQEISENTGNSIPTCKRYCKQGIELIKNNGDICDILKTPAGYVSGVSVTHIFSRKKHITLTKNERKACKEKGIDPHAIPAEQKPGKPEILKPLEYKNRKNAEIKTIENARKSYIESMENWENGLLKGFSGIKSNNPLPALTLKENFTVKPLFSQYTGKSYNGYFSIPMKISGFPIVHTEKIGDTIISYEITLGNHKVNDLKINRQKPIEKTLDGMPVINWHIARYNRAYDMGKLSLSELIMQCPVKAA